MDRKRKLEVADPVQPGRQLNPFTGRPYSNRYYEILDKRMGEALIRQAVHWEFESQLVSTIECCISSIQMPGLVLHMKCMGAFVRD